MKNPNNTLGLILLIAGALLLLNNLDLLKVDLHEAIKFWPLLLVYSGLVLLVGGKKGYAVSFSMVAITALSIIVYFVFRNMDDYHGFFSI